LIVYLAIAFVAVYVIDAVIFKKFRPLLWIFAIAIIFFSGTYSVLWNVDHIFIFLLLGIIGGQLLFYLSLVLSKLSVKRAIPQIYSIRDMCRLIMDKKRDVVESMAMVAREELLWRCAIQQILGNTWPAVSITAICFSLVHLDLKEDTFYVSHCLDLLIFSFILGILFHYFNNFYLVVAIHFVRNMNIAGIKYRKERCEAAVLPAVPDA
jgi:hypothetical protein